MPGELDLAAMLASLDVEHRPGRFTFVTGEWPALSRVAQAMIVEAEGPTYVVSVEEALASGAPVEFEAAWLTITVWSSLEAVGLTAAISRAMADAGIACNALAGYHHDHVLVPIERLDEAVRVLTCLCTG